MKTVTTFVFLAMLTVGASSNAAGLWSEGRQNFFYYFGAPCATTCATPAPCAAPVVTCKPMCPPAPCMITCCPEVRGIFD